MMEPELYDVKDKAPVTYPILPENPTEEDYRIAFHSMERVLQNRYLRAIQTAEVLRGILLQRRKRR